MNIEKFYYDEQTEMYEQMKKEQDEHEQSLSVEEREKEHQKLFQEARTIMEKAERKKKEEYQITYPTTLTILEYKVNEISNKPFYIKEHNQKYNIKEITQFLKKF